MQEKHSHVVLDYSADFASRPTQHCLGKILLRNRGAQVDGEGLARPHSQVNRYDGYVSVHQQSMAARADGYPAPLSGHKGPLFLYATTNSCANSGITEVGRRSA